MKTKVIAKKHNLNNADFDRWLKQSGFSFTSGRMGGIDVDDSQNLDEILVSFRQHLVHEKERLAGETSDRERVEAEKREALATMLIATGFSFEGHCITRYAGYISGSLATIPSRATVGRKASSPAAAHGLGCNAVIGVDFDYLTLDHEPPSTSCGTTYLPYVFGVTANGTAIIIESQAQTI